MLGFFIGFFTGAAFSLVIVSAVYLDRYDD